MSNFLITGGTGSLGSVLSQKLISLGHHLTILNKDSHKQSIARRALPADTKFILADICDPVAVREACEGQDIVIHAAAIKRLEVGEYHPTEMARVNIDGTRNVALACREARVPRCLFISSDKATGPTFYGVSKKIGEGLWLAQNSTNSKFAGIRYGNVVNSAGSVWHLWSEMIRNNKPIPVRTPEPTRFILDLNQAVELVLESIELLRAYNKCVFVPCDLPAFSVWDLAREMMPDDSYWLMSSYVTNERQHEQLIANDEFAVPTSKHLWRTSEWYEMHVEDRARFSSNTAPRISGGEVIHRMKNV